MKVLDHGMKIRKELVLLDEIEYYTQSYSYYDSGCRRIYKFIDSDDNIYIWKTSNVLGVDTFDSDMNEVFEIINVGDKIFLAGNVKEMANFRGEDQIVLTRCKALGVIEHYYYSDEDIINIRRKFQLSKFDNYEIKTVRYKEYKTDYSQYETLIGSFIRTDNGCFIDIIITE